MIDTSLTIPPLPVFNVYFDGGGSHDNAYGSFEIVFNGMRVTRHRMPFACHNVNGFKVTSNVAEYLSLCAALKWLETVKEKQQYRVDVYGDSRLVVYQVNGRYGCNKPHLKPLMYLCRRRLNEFREWSTHWHSRVHSVRRFGH
jgi:ribonuclease H / adenosylcobalamin/alpha-ribazole phosphatase